MTAKLVRDRVPELIRRDGQIPVTHTLNAAEYRRALLDKLVEEAEEARRAGNTAELVVELADLREVIDAIIDAYGISRAMVQQTRRDKNRLSGRFTRRILLEQVVEG